MKNLLHKYGSLLFESMFHHRKLAGYIEPVVQIFRPNWRQGYYRAQVLKLSSIEANTICLELKVPRSWPIHKAGQHIELTREIDGRLVTRVFTIASSPAFAHSDRRIQLVIKPQQHGAFTKELYSLRKNDWINLSAPYGEFQLNSSAPAVLMLAAGSGITPFLSMLRQQLPATKISPAIHLLYFAKAREHLFADELVELTKTLPQFSLSLMSRQEHGAASTHLSEFHHAEIMVCGPTEFYQDIANYCQTHDLPLQSEHFSLLPVQLEKQAEFEVEVNGEKLQLSNAQSLLSQLLAKDKPVAYGCGMGICHQCQCVKHRGVVKDMRTGEISDRGEELIQLCVSQAVTELELSI